MESQKSIKQDVCVASILEWGIRKSRSLFFLPLEGGGPEVGVKLCPLTPTLSHGGERENEVKSDFIEPSPRKMTRRNFLRGYQQ